MRRLPGALLLALVLPACDSASPSPSDTPRFNAFLDGQSWVADTALAIAFASPTDTALTVTAVKRISPTESQEITVFLKSWTKGVYTRPGRASILSLTRSDSLIAGSLQVEAATAPDTLPHRVITATFRLKYSIQQVFTPEDPDAI